MARGKAGTVAEAGSASTLSVGEALPKRRASRLPTAAHFPLVVVLSFALTSLGYSTINQSTSGELASFARHLSTVDVAFTAGWSM
jgi:hypothetical protein